MFSRTDEKKVVLYGFITAVVTSVITAILQYADFLSLYHRYKGKILAVTFVLLIASLIFLTLKHKLNEDTGAEFIFVVSSVIRSAYVLISGLYERQHDAGAYTGAATDFVNPGHIGYAEYIYKFGKIPQIDPYSIFGYYHPPLHYIIEAIWIKINVLLGVSEECAFENMQIPTLFYSCLLIIICYQILSVLDIRGRNRIIALAFIAFHPATIIMSGSVNNDMLTVLFMAIVILLTLSYIREKTVKTLVLLALGIGFGMLTKLNAVVMAAPVGLVFLIHFIQICKTKNKSDILLWVRNYIIFAILAMPIGLSWIIRNLIRFGKFPAALSPGTDSPMYTGDYSLWERIGIPGLSQWHFDFPFHPLRASACCNTWAIMFHTAIYAEEYPVDIEAPLLLLCQITFILGIILAADVLIMLIKVCLDKRTAFEDRIFIMTGYIAIIFSFVVFVLVYPYTCSSDFRYIAICLVYSVIAIGLANKYKYKKIAVFNGAIFLFLVMIHIIYLLWW